MVRLLRKKARRRRQPAAHPAPHDRMEVGAVAAIVAPAVGAEAAIVAPAVGAEAATVAALVAIEATGAVAADALAAQEAGLAIATAMCHGARFAPFVWMM